MSRRAFFLATVQSGYSLAYPTSPATKRVVNMDSPRWRQAGYWEHLSASSRPDIAFPPGGQGTARYANGDPPQGTTYQELTLVSTGQPEEGVRLYGYAGAGAYLLVYLDGELVQTLNDTGFYASMHLLLIDLFDLSPGTHTVRVEKGSLRDQYDSSVGVAGADVYTYSLSYP